ncbi:MAG: methyl-accepting chemotaxis protein, partial [Desulfobacula sp.]|nr:methyl-accepting chemotaxis protein [Desulfobacula sp.]
SEEMNAQAEQLKDYVGDLVQLVSGQKGQTATFQAHREVKTISSKPMAISTGQNKMLSSSSKEVRPDQVIPFDDDEDFENF